MSDSWNRISVQNVRGSSRLIECKNHNPLKILNPKTVNGTCYIVISGYGGGMVSGDHIQIKIDNQSNTTAFIGTQANTRIFEQSNGSKAKLEVDADLHENSLTVIFPDPVVLQKNSRLKQKQTFNLKTDSILFLVDWFNSGRIDIGEQHQYYSYHSEVEIYYENKLKVLDRFYFDPKQHISSSPANFGPYHSMFTAYLIGNPLNNKFQGISNQLLKFNDLHSNENNEIFTENGNNHALVSSVSEASEGVYILRTASRSRNDLIPLCNQIMEILKEDDYLGFNPWVRKY